jgi:phage terminase large subunit-like protein
MTEIDIAEVRAWVQQLRKYGYPIKAVTYDGWMSQESIQAWRKSGIKSGHLSVDKTSGPYKAFREALYDERLRGYYQPVIAEEMTQLEYDEKKDKVDHPVTGSKDGLDGVCGAYNSMLKRSRNFVGTDHDAAEDEQVNSRPDLGDRFDFDGRT